MKKKTAFKPQGISSEGVIQFSEGIFSVAATIGVIPLTSIDTSNRDLKREEIMDLIREKLVSFERILTIYLVIVFLRKEHVNLFRHIKKVDFRLTSLNHGFLLVINLLTFSIAAVDTYHHERLPAVLFGLVILTGVVFWLLTLFLAKYIGVFECEPGEHEHITDTQKRTKSVFRNTVSRVLLYSAVLAGVIFVSNYIGEYAFFFLVVLLLMPSILYRIPMFSGLELAKEVQFDKDRFLSFRDGIFCTLATFLVLDITLPDSSTHESFETLLKRQLPLFIGYFTCFFVSVVLWTLYHDICDYIEDMSASLELVHMCWLGLITIIPFVSQFLALDRFLDTHKAESVERFVLIVIFLLCLSLFVLWLLTYRFAKCDTTRLDRRMFRIECFRILSLPFICVAAFPFTYLFRRAAALTFLTPIVWFLLPRKYSFDVIDSSSEQSQDLLEESEESKDLRMKREISSSAPAINYSTSNSSLTEPLLSDV